jgi:hypothetical protein
MPNACKVVVSFVHKHFDLHKLPSYVEDYSSCQKSMSLHLLRRTCQKRHDVQCTITWVFIIGLIKAHLKRSIEGHSVALSMSIEQYAIAFQKDAEWFIVAAAAADKSSAGNAPGATESPSHHACFQSYHAPMRACTSKAKL